MAINYEVKQGECISSIAFEQGFFPDTIWDHPGNAELKKNRKDPNVLMLDDIVFVPDKQLKEVSKPTNAVHKFRCKNTPKILSIQFMNFDTPLANLGYKIEIDGKKIEGTTNSAGWLKQAIPPNAKLAKLVLNNGSIFELKLGELDPVDEVTGVQGRLHSLGFYNGSLNGQMDDETKSALRGFQHSHDLEETGENDDQTKELLIKMTGK